MDILCTCSGYKFFNKLDISMQYYTFKIDEHIKDLCTTINPFGQYKFLKLPIGLKCSPDIAQSMMGSVLDSTADADVYTDDVGVYSTDWNHHVTLLSTILCHL
ncbi:hypothetical protein ACHAW6_016131 [Cyclotella cf. meneghiniana]